MRVRRGRKRPPSIETVNQMPSNGGSAKGAQWRVSVSPRMAGCLSVTQGKKKKKKRGCQKMSSGGHTLACNSIPLGRIRVQLLKEKELLCSQKKASCLGRVVTSATCRLSQHVKLKRTKKQVETYYYFN